jgi:hypothetical protein
MSGPLAGVGGAAALEPIPWTEAEPARLARDLEEVSALASGLRFHEPSLDLGSPFRHGGWSGELARWPFDRPEPDRLRDLVGDRGLVLELEYSAAHPMLPPAIYPLDPLPEIVEQTQATWHVAPGGSLCLLQSAGGWRPEASITELLLKAAGWRIEYALMKVGVIERMSVAGIVSDNSLDGLIAEAAQRSRLGSEASQEADGNDDDGSSDV